MVDLREQCSTLWAAFREGEEAAFRQLYDVTYPALFRYGRNFTGDGEQVRDAMQEAYVGLWNRRSHPEPVERPWVFLLVSLRNGLIDALRRDRPLPPDPGPPGQTESPEADLLDRERSAQRNAWVRAHLDRLPQRQREALHLRYLHELDYPDIARIMDVSRQVAYNYVNRGIGSLRQTLDKYPEWLLGLVGWWLVG